MAVPDLVYDEELFPSGLRSVLERLTITSDKRDCTQEWVGCFTANAVILRNGKTSTGRDEITEMIERSWDNVEWRNHKPRKIYALGKGTHDVFVRGSTEYQFQDGRFHEGQWGAEISFVEVNGEWKIQAYTVVFV
ncbi:uncharacterized protein N7511_005370 [Penicillium nucicola]|uniref:uncharacterized protein n=1 Tax=Penicillium nucicola TaxID=1850975 RepID=UPI0025454C8F|nr:uncharacterized protein N7511_005370 [Penicillium nucicola]KAJ5761988.1 hypothetical protein N7511_005370 [Penicillium nucicola]